MQESGFCVAFSLKQGTSTETEGRAEGVVFTVSTGSLVLSSDLDSAEAVSMGTEVGAALVVVGFRVVVVLGALVG